MSGYLTPREILEREDMRPLPPGNDITAKIVRSRFGYWAHITHGCAKVSGPLFSFTRRGIDRKARRLAQRLRTRDQAYAEAEKLVL